MKVLTTILFATLVLPNVHGQESTKAYYFGIGGGYEPQRSQAVLQKNIEIFHGLVCSVNPDGENESILFASGKEDLEKDITEKTKDVYTDDELLFGLLTDSDPNKTYGHNELNKIFSGKKTVFNEATVQNIKDEFLRIKQSGSEKLRFYYTGHGSHEKDTFSKNYMLLWNNETMPVQDFAALLHNAMGSDEENNSKEAQIVMVQCYSGGFAQINYIDGELNGDLSDKNSCGFFSQVPDRSAAGCSDDLNKREEYSPYFLSAYKKIDESKNPVDADYNKDGKITSDEAHAYVIINENSFDIPTTTSSQLLRDLFSDMDKVPVDYKKRSWKEFYDSFNTVEKAIADGLLAKTGLQTEILNDDSPYNKIKWYLDFYTNKLCKPFDEAVDSFSKIETIIKDDLSQKYPDLGLKLLQNPQDKTIQDELAQAKKDLLSHPLYQIYKQGANTKDPDTQKTCDTYTQIKAKLERLQYLLNTKILEQHLNKKCEDEGKKYSKYKLKYEQLKKCEAQPFFI